MPKPIAVDGLYGQDSATALRSFQSGNGLNVTGVLMEPSATMLLQLHAADGWKDPGGPLPNGALYKVYIPVFRNRSIETAGFLMDTHGVTRHVFQCRTHGQNQANGEPLNEWSSDGATPTGLSMFDLNSPEPDPKSFGPYPVNRAAYGLEGNFKDICTDSSDTVIRRGILLHTGEWQGWAPPMPMPNSHGCIHAHPDDIKAIWQILTNDLGVVVRNNTFGALPYPYKPQGLLSVELID